MPQIPNQFLVRHFFARLCGATATSRLFFGTVNQVLRPFRRISVAALFVLLFSLSLPAQAPVAPSAPAESKSFASKPDYSKEPAIYEFRHASMRYENDGSSVREVTGRIRVQTAAGLAFAGQLVFPYTAVDEEVEIRGVRVLKPDGSIITSGPEAVQDLTAQVSREAPM